MNIICQTIKFFLEKYQLNNPELTYLVAFSGGYDSMCLLDALKKTTKNKIIAIHLNHKWRGTESDNEELNCKEFCSSIGVEFYSENLSCEVSKTETAARNARYLFFENCAKKFNSDIIFTAHNKNDNAETLIYRICKGTGIYGLQGICENRDIYYRPLLTIARETIEKYCKTYKLIPNNDSSNSDIKYKRNYIRTNVIPELVQINSNCIDMINSLSEIAIEENSIIEEYLTKTIDKISENGKFKTSKFLKLSDAMQKKIVYNIFTVNKIDYDREKIINVWNFIRENVKSKSGKTCSLTTNLWVYVSEKTIEITDREIEDYQNIHIIKEGKYETDKYILEIEKFEKPVKKFPSESEFTAYINLKNIPINFDLRTRQDGDIIQPFGMNGTQKLKKYLNSKKIPNHEKDNLLFLTYENEILWAIGLGINDKIKVTTYPTHRLKFSNK